MQAPLIQGNGFTFQQALENPLALIGFGRGIIDRNLLQFSRRIAQHVRGALVRHQIAALQVQQENRIVGLLKQRLEARFTTRSSSAICWRLLSSTERCSASRGNLQCF